MVALGGEGDSRISGSGMSPASALCGCVTFSKLHIPVAPQLPYLQSRIKGQSHVLHSTG